MSMSSFIINNPEKCEFRQGYTFENFIGQFQINCPKLLCIINGTNLQFYDKEGQFPNDIIFDRKLQKDNITQYYFKNIDNNIAYCVFGREAATLFYSHIDEWNSNSKLKIFDSILVDKNKSKKIILTKIPKDKNISDTIIFDKGIKLLFPNPNYSVEIKKYNPMI